MKPWPPELGARTVIHYTALAHMLRSQSRSKTLARMASACWRYTVAPASAVSKSGYRFCVRPPWLFFK